MRLLMKIFGLVLLLGLAVWAIRTDSSGDVSQPPPAAAVGDGSWRQDPIWDDGRAEYCAYEIDWARYGARYPGRAQLVLVKEPWAPDLGVKADREREDGFEVLKLNHVRDVPTGIYTYHQMASAFVRRDGGELEKLATASAEACGLSTATVAGGQLETRSYFDGQGERSLPYPQGALPEDALPAMLRDFVSGPVPAEVAVFPSLLAGRFPDLEAVSYRLDRAPAAPLEVPAGRFQGVELRLENRDRWMTYTFEEAAPHRLLALATSDGTEYRLAKCDRLDYWNLNRPGGEQWLPERLR